MKLLLGIILGVGLGITIGSFIGSKRATLRYEARSAAQQTAWDNERAALENLVDEAKARPTPLVPLPAPPSSSPRSASTPKATPAEIVASLRALRSGAGPDSRTLRRALYQLEELILAGPVALPAIREFLARNEDVDFDSTAVSRGARSVPGDFVVPPSLRFGLFDVVKQIGGPGAENLLAETLKTTTRGVELAWLARTLQGISPDSYRDAALTAARELLSRAGSQWASRSPLDRNDREQLYSVLLMYGDSSYASIAQTQILQPDGQVDRSTLKYLQQALGAQSIPLAAQLYDDPRLADPATKEPLARLALNFVGADGPANEFYQKAINDMTLTAGHRKNLIEDLNQDGFPDTKNLTARDLPLIQNRIQLIEQLAPSATDPANIAAFREAYKDLIKMRERVMRPPGVGAQ